MHSIEFNGKVYKVDEDEFLVSPDLWDEDFAEGMALKNGISGGLTTEHWKVIKFIRKYFLENGTSPLVYKTCLTQGMRSPDLAKLFPTGYRRGACKLAGLSYLADDIFLSRSKATNVEVPLEERVYRVDIMGYLIDPAEWDCDYAIYKMREMKMPEATKKHSQIIEYLRIEYFRTGSIPTVHRACAANGIELDELEQLFPDGYHRGVVKIAGLPSLGRAQKKSWMAKSPSNS